MTRDKVFISYSQHDRGWLGRLQKMLRPLVRKGTIDLWADTELQAGVEWRQEITSALTSARVAVLLVSSDFLASDFIAEEQLPPLLRAAEEEGMTILWVYLSPCLFEETAIRKYRAAHDVTMSLDQLSAPEQQQKLKEIAREIKKAVAKPRATALGWVALEQLSQRQEVLALPDRGDGIARVLSLHLGPTTVVGRCYAAQLRAAAQGALRALLEDRLHWVLAWDDDRLPQLMVRLRCQLEGEGGSVEVQNVAGYSSRRPSFSVTADVGIERKIAVGETVEVKLQPGVALTLTSSSGSGRQQILRWTSEIVAFGNTRLPVLHTTATTFLFPPGGLDATLVRYLGVWIPAVSEDLERFLAGAPPVAVGLTGEALDLRLSSSSGGLRVESAPVDLRRLLAMEQNAVG